MSNNPAAMPQPAPIDLVMYLCQELLEKYPPEEINNE